MHITVTGSSGFIGRHLVKKLEEDGHEITVWDRNIGKDILNFEPGTSDFVIHLAATADVRRSIREPELYWEQNVLNTKNIQQLCHHLRIPLLYASSSCAKHWNLSPYGASKRINEVTAFPGQVGMRFTTVYGEGARDSMFMGKLKEGKLEYATNHIRDFIHVDDVIQAIDLIMKKMVDPHTIPTSRLMPIYDIGTGIGNSVEQLAKSKFPDIEVREGEACEAIDNTANIDQLLSLGWKQTVTVEDYLR